MRQKQLDTTGSKIESYSLKVENRVDSGVEFQQIFLSLIVDDKDRGREEYKYRISGDSNFSIPYLESKIPEALDFAKENYNKVTIKEYTERDYLYFHVHDKKYDIMKVTGVRLK